MKRKKTFLAFKHDIAIDPDQRPDITRQQELLSSDSRLLNRTDRIIFKLVSSDQYTQAEVATLLGISESSLSYHVAHIKKVLRHEFSTACQLPRRHRSEELKAIRLACFNNRTAADIARQTGLSLYRIKKYLSPLKQTRA
jgi:DNA-binding CsgD family transcriptional regulator